MDEDDRPEPGAATREERRVVTALFADRVACIPLVYGRNVAYVRPGVHGWWEFGKSSSSFADLTVEGRSDARPEGVSR